MAVRGDAERRFVHLNGRLCPVDEAAIDPADRGFLLADGLFETLRAYDGRISALDAHLARLRAGAAELAIPLPEHDVAAAAAETLEANGLASSDAALRVTLTRGPGPRGLALPPEPAPTILIVAMPLTAPPSGPVKAAWATTRRNEQSPLSRLKTLGYLDNVLALRDAKAAGADEAILLNTAGRLASATAANLFLVRARTLLTPPPSEGVLPGIVRATLMELAPALGLSLAEAPLEPAQLAEADEAFLTNSLVGVRGIASLDGRPLGAGGEGETTRRIRQALEAQFRAGK